MKRSRLEREIHLLAWGIVLIMAIILVVYLVSVYQSLDGMEWVSFGIVGGMFLTMILWFQLREVRLSRDQTEILSQWLQDDARQG